MTNELGLLYYVVGLSLFACVILMDNYNLTCLHHAHYQLSAYMFHLLTKLSKSLNRKGK